jgi:ribosome maturation factor RimP
MVGSSSDTPVAQRVRELVEPIVSDLSLDLYDVEQRGGTLRVTVDTPPGSDAGVDLDQLALATRLISRELDHTDPVPGRYTLEVTSPGVERTLRTAAHFQREIGKTISLRLTNVSAEERRVEGVLIAADDTTATFRVERDGDLVEQVVALADVDRARTVFEWGPQPKPGGKGAPKKNAKNKKQQSKSKQSMPKQSGAADPDERLAVETPSADEAEQSSATTTTNKEPS